MKTAYLGFLHESLIRIAQPHSHEVRLSLERIASREKLGEIER
eukprot:COSAG02_NODE_70508_length_195_cov_65.239583_2_plen_43_part_01